MFQNLSAQNFSEKEQKKIDSLSATINNPNSNDTSRINALVELGLTTRLYRISYWDSIVTDCQNIIDTHPSAPVEHNLLNSLASALNSIGFIHNSQGEIPKALEYFHKSMKISKKIGKKDEIASNLINIGYIYKNQGDTSKALEYYNKSLKVYEEIGSKEGVAYNLHNIGVIYSNRGDTPKAMDYYLKSLELREEVGDKRGIANSLHTLGILFNRKGETSKALEYLYKSLKISEDMGSKRNTANTLGSIAKVLLNTGQVTEAKKHATRAMKLAQELGFPENIRNVTGLLSEIYAKENKGMLALEMYQLHILMRDSINNDRNLKASTKQEAKYEYEKQKAIDDLKNEKLIAIEKQEKEKQQILTIATAGSLGLVVIFLIFVFNRLRVTKKQKLVIEEQKEIVEIAHHELEEKNQEIMDSITYAKRIQSAILPPDKVVKEYLQDSFILYKPKDIVAGDFYWMEQKNGKVLFAAADCTGHGVPGAMVSVVCNNALNRSVREHGLTDPGEILDKSREIVIQEFEKSDEEVKDGMDIALCSLEKNILQYAGAHNPLWIIRKGEVLETKANKQPIGKFDNKEPYTTHSFELQKGDSIYIFSDGYVDQFGGEKRKKFKVKAFRALLLSIQDKSMEEQKIIIDEVFDAWKGELEQIDDVCVIGVRI